MRRAVPLFVVGAALCLVSCRTPEEKAERERQKAEEERQKHSLQVKTPIPPDSPLAKVTYGMGEAEVASILGMPTSQESGITGKQFIPFNFAQNDTYRTVYYYKGMGRIYFSRGGWGQNTGAVEVQYDAEEPGYKPH